MLLPTGKKPFKSKAGDYPAAVEVMTLLEDDMNEPVADEVRSILDCHIILSSELAVFKTRGET